MIAAGPDSRALWLRHSYCRHLFRKRYAADLPFKAVPRRAGFQCESTTGLTTGLLIMGPVGNRRSGLGRGTQPFHGPGINAPGGPASRPSEILRYIRPLLAIPISTSRSGPPFSLIAAMLWIDPGIWPQPV